MTLTWILEITVVGFLAGEPALQFDGVYEEKFATEKACNDFKQSNKVSDEVEALKRIARRHLNDTNAEVTVKSKCVPDGEPA